MSLSFKSQIAPKGLEFKPSEIIISGKYCSIMTIVSYPKSISEGYLANLTQVSGIKVCIKHIPIAFSVLAKMLNKEIAEIYKNINLNPVMIEYNLSKERFNQILQKISLVINKSAEGIDPYMIEVNDDHNDCTGSCYSCEGCK